MKISVVSPEGIPIYLQKVVKVSQYIYCMCILVMAYVSCDTAKTTDWLMYNT